MRLKGANIVVEAIRAEGIETVFGYPGGGALPLYDALYDSGLRHVLTRHEQGAVHAADGYARFTGKVGVCISTSGPGATNLITGIATANMDSIPMVCITCQVVRAAIGKDSFQEADVVGITTPITKHNFLVQDVNDLALTLKKAFYIARSGRPGPVVVDIPKDVFLDEAEWDYPENLDHLHWSYQPKTEGGTADLQAILDVINRSHSPVLFVGGGVVSSGASDLLRELVAKTKIPVVASLMGLTAYPTDDELHLGMLGMHGTYAANMAVQHADLLIGVGVRFDDRVTGTLNTFAAGARVVHLDIDPAEFNKNVRIDYRLAGDLKWSLPLLMQAETGNLSDWLANCAKWKQEHPMSYEKSAEVIKPEYVLEELNDLTRGEAVIATDVGQHQMWSAQYLDFKHPRTFLTSGGLGTMGYGLPAALGAAVLAGDKEVWLVSSDGSIMMNCQEMATLTEENLPVKMLILNNRGLGMVRQWQRMFFNNRMSASKHEFKISFAKLAEAMGCTGITVEKAEDVRAALEQARNTPGPVLVEVLVDEEENVMPMVAPGKSLSEMVFGGSDY
ncbi:MAG: biosynthetic-type acetolactate synthase large subunit [Firmicutes bacterium]|nr:biosynthetic-type acetolactate synthase large subunit [Bacillota bacterium]